MNNHLNGKFRSRRIQALIAAGALVAGLGLASTASADPINVSASVGGVPSGTNYENFDKLPLGGTGGSTDSGIIVSFAPDGEAVQGGLPNMYAQPYLSNSNGMQFGDPMVSGQDTTTYLIAGLGSVTLTFPGQERYIGLLWGSVDSENTLTFFNGATQVGSITGDDVTALPTGDQGLNGTFYVNINTSMAFDRVVMTTAPKRTFEFDNVAFDTQSIGVPEPGIFGMFFLGLLLVGSGYWLKRRRLTLS